MPTTPLFPLPEGLEMTSISETSEQLLVRVTSHRSSSLCPHCSTPSSAIHSYYRRHPRDLPCDFPSHSVGSHGPQILLSQPRLFLQSVHRTAPRFP